MRTATLEVNGKIGTRPTPPAALVARPAVHAARRSASRTVAATWRHRSRILVVAALAATVSVLVWQAPTRLVFRAFGATDVINLLTILFLVALLAERALEIFVGTWRSPEASQLELRVQRAEHDLAALEKAPGGERALGEARAACEAARRQELQYRCITRQVALWAGLALGLLVSGVGVRALGTLIDPGQSGLSAHQLPAFRFVDVLLTGGVIAGGSEGIHKVATLFDSFMSAAARRARG
jgi:hypothetical protein